ncbi:MAG: efflux RND transporter periplasmic adaptor subunit [Magnetococcales bacterium]|nr:efflux RND transporter periplasmic adaptor subunit [Magnetococcales bacterium]
METSTTKTLIPYATITLLACLSACTGGGEETAAGQAAPPPVLVSVAPVVQKDFPIVVHAVGNAESCHTVQIKSQIDGEIIKVNFADGQEVKKGDLLFELDDRHYKNRLAQLQADLQKDLAQRDNARAREQRQVLLNKKNITSEENLELSLASRLSLDAAVASDRAAIAEGELQLSHTRILAPISGMTGRILLFPGNLVKANDSSPLVVLSQIEPMCLSFTVPEHHLTAIRSHQAQAPLSLEVIPHRETGDPLAASLTALDNVIDRQTASIRLKARADNPQRRLWPGMFVRVAMKLAVRANALIIPTIAIQSGPKGSFVYVIKENKTAESRPVTLFQENKDETVIETGLSPGETVVTVGHWRLKPGAMVAVAANQEPTGGGQTPSSPQGTRP